MRLDEFLSTINEVRMGAKELSAKPSIPINMGFEAEVIASGEGNDDGDYGDNFDEFLSEWDDQPTEEDYWDENFGFFGSKLIESLTPKYGYSTEYDIAKMDYERKLRKYNSLKGTPDIELVRKGDETDDPREKLFYYAKAQNPSRTEEEVANKIKELSDDGVIEMLPSYVSLTMNKRAPIEPQPEDFDEDEVVTDYIKDEDGNLLDDDELYELGPERFFELFEEDNSKWGSNYERWKEDYFFEYYQEVENQAYDRWLSNRPAAGSAFTYTAETMDRYVSQKVDISDSYHGTYKNQKNYTLEPDSSLEAHGDGAGVEIVSPVFRSYDEGIEALSDILSMIRDEDFSTNSSTGLHINISFPNINTQEIDLLKLFMFLGDRHILSVFGRENNTYAKNYIEHIYNHLSDGTDTLDGPQIAKVMRYLNNHAEKYRSVNLSHLKDKGYFEIRAMGGAGYEHKEEAIIHQINRFVRAISIAIDPHAHKEEYLKKLYKLKSSAAPDASSQQKNNNRLIRALENDMDTSMSGNGYNSVENWLAYRHDDKPYKLSPNTKIMLRDYLMTLPKDNYNATWWFSRQDTPVSLIFQQVAKKRGLL